MYYPIMAYNLLLSTTNVRGLNSEVKRKEVFSMLKHREYDVSFLQETHSTSDQEAVWQHQWGFSGSIYFAHGASTARGVATLIRHTDLRAIRVFRKNTGCYHAVQ